MKRKISLTESVEVSASPAEVWDFTQDYGRRAEWDRSVLSAEVVETVPAPRVRLKFRGGLSCVFQYKLFERPRKTSLAMVEIESGFIAGGGGSWTYTTVDGGTRWTQTNTVFLKDSWFSGILRPLVELRMRADLRRSMKRAKKIIEKRKDAGQ